MALQKIIEINNSALEANYHKINDITIYDNTCSFRVYVFKDSSSRLANKSPILQENYSISVEDFSTYFDLSILDQVGKNPYTQAYEYLKTLPEYSGALDV